MSIVTYISFAATCDIPSLALLRLTQLGLVFFQLALSPSPRTPSEPIPVQNTQQLTLKVEGVVQHGSSPGLFRKIQSVCLNVTSVLQSKTGPDFKVYTQFLSTDPITSLSCGWVAAQLILTLPYFFYFFRFLSTPKPMRSSSGSNPTMTTSAPSSCCISPSWALTPSPWRPPWWMRVALSGRRGPRRRCLSSPWRILTPSSSAISCSRLELSLLLRGVPMPASRRFNSFSLCTLTWNWICKYFLCD